MVKLAVVQPESAPKTSRILVFSPLAWMLVLAAKLDGFARETFSLISLLVGDNLLASLLSSNALKCLLRWLVYILKLVWSRAIFIADGGSTGHKIVEGKGTGRGRGAASWGCGLGSPHNVHINPYCLVT